MEGALRISAAEWQVMKVAWGRPGASAQEIIASLPESTDWSPATVKTLLGRLVRKGALTFRKEGKLYLYFPDVTEEQCRDAEAESFLDRVFDGSLTPMIAHFVRTRPLSRQQIAELEEILRRKEGE